MKASCANIDTGCTCSASYRQDFIQKASPVRHRGNDSELLPPATRWLKILSFSSPSCETAHCGIGVAWGTFQGGLAAPAASPPLPTFHVAGSDVLIGVLEAATAVPLPSTARGSCICPALRLCVCETVLPQSVSQT